MDKWRHYSSFLAALVLVVGVLAWIVVPSGQAGPPQQNPGQPFAEILAAIANLQGTVDNLPTGGEGNHTIRWDQELDSTNGDGNPTTGCNSDRCKCIFGGDAVSDLETGLVWEQSPGNTDGDSDVDNADKLLWAFARTECTDRTVGGRKGWRLPSVHELASLVDTSNSNPALPTNHPFSDIKSDIYWSATFNVSPTGSAAFRVKFAAGAVGVSPRASQKFFVWCVRGGMNSHVY